MMVTEIEELSKARVKVCTDNGATFALYKGELRRFCIENGKELPDDAYRQIMEEILPKRAKVRCMNLLKSRDYTEHRLRIKLRQGLYPDRIIDEALLYVRSYGYIDDVRYAERYIEQARTVKSRRQIENSLIQKGISKEDIGTAYARYDAEESFVNECAVIRRLLVKRRYDSQSATYEERRKIIGFLYRKGFSLENIYQAVEAD
ncbi:MAG: RecX family transcriptional regulator [Roseburia sp.]|nr:RecX family transcriptional regulator [Roseburia sp.]